MLGALFGSKGGEEEAEKLRQESRASTEKALEEFRKVILPNIEAERLDLETPELIGLLKSKLLEDTRLADIETDPRLKESQEKALARMEEIGEQGLTEEDRILYDALKRRRSGEESAQQAAIKQSFAERGLGGSGQELAQRLLQQQKSADRALEETQQQALQKQQARTAALMQAGQMAGGMETQEYERQKQLAQARDAISQFNLQNQQNIAARNLDARQRIADAATQTRNLQQQQNKSLLQKKFENEMRLSGAKAGIRSGQANLLSQQAGQYAAKPSSPGMFTPLATLVGGAIGAYYGGPTGASAGASAGSAVGQMGTNYMQNKEDGGVVEKEYANGGMVDNDYNTSLLTPRTNNVEELDRFTLDPKMAKTKKSALEELLSDNRKFESDIINPESTEQIKMDQAIQGDYIPEEESKMNPETLAALGKIASMMKTQTKKPTQAAPSWRDVSFAPIKAADGEVSNLSDQIRASVRKMLNNKNQEPDKDTVPSATGGMGIRGDSGIREASDVINVRNANSIDNSPREMVSPKLDPSMIPVEELFSPKKSLDKVSMKLYNGGVVDNTENSMTMENAMQQQERIAPNANLKQIYADEIVDATPEKYADGGCKSKKNYEEGGIEEAGPYVGDRVDAKINNGEMVLNVDQQQRLLELLRGRLTPPEMPIEEDIVEPANAEQTNLHEKNKELEARIQLLEEMLNRG